MAVRTLYVLFAAFALRSLLFRSGAASWMKERAEIGPPLTSWRSVQEGAYLSRSGISPYSSDLVHQPPLVLELYKIMIYRLPNLTEMIFIVADLLTVWLMASTVCNFCEFYMNKQGDDASAFHKDSQHLVLTASQMHASTSLVTICYALNPFLVASCIGQSTVVLENLVLAAFLFYFSRGQRTGACFFLSIAAYMALYPVLYIVPLCLMLVHKHKYPLFSFSALMVYTRTVFTFAFFCSILLFYSYTFAGGWHWMRNCYGFILTASDFTPSISTYWYFLAEMFDHFNLFFVIVFQCHLLVYLFPLTIKLHDDPVLLQYMLLCLVTIYKSYPSLGDVGFYLALIPLYQFVQPYQRNAFLSGCITLTTLVLGPVQWFLWLYAGSANANFYFAVTLAFAAGQVFLVTDLLYAYLKRNFHLLHGPKPKWADTDKDAAIIVE